MTENRVPEAFAGVRHDRFIHEFVYDWDGSMYMPSIFQTVDQSFNYHTAKRVKWQAALDEIRSESLGVYLTFALDGNFMRMEMRQEAEDKRTDGTQTVHKSA